MSMGIGIAPDQTKEKQMQSSVQVQEDYATDDAKTIVVEKIQCENQFRAEDGKRWASISQHDGMDPQTLASSYLEAEDIYDVKAKLHNDHQLINLLSSPRLRHISAYIEQMSEENYVGVKITQSKQGFMTRQVTGPAIRAAATNMQQGFEKGKPWYRKVV